MNTIKRYAPNKVTQIPNSIIVATQKAKVFKIKTRLELKNTTIAQYKKILSLNFVCIKKNTYIVTQN